MGKLDEFRSLKDQPLLQNKLLFEWLCDDAKRRAFYDELNNNGFPILRFKSALRLPSRTASDWPHEDVYLLSAQADVNAALAGYSVEPYGSLESGGRFMLGLDDPDAHLAQNAVAAKALVFNPDDQIRAVACEAFRRAAVQPLKQHDFDLVAMAEQAALHFASLLFGLPDKAHTRLQRLIYAVYRRLTFQIIGRHFVANAGLPPSRSADAEKLKRELEGYIRDEHVARHADGLIAKGLPGETVIGRLYAHFGRPSDPENDEVVFITLGLIAGTIGNVRAAVANVMAHFFDSGQVPDARRAAWIDEPDDETLRRLIDKALLHQPAAPFLARRSRRLDKPHAPFADIPDSALVLLAIGADPDPALLFGGHDFMHRCIGKHLAQPLVEQIVRGVLRLPGLAQRIDPDTGEPFGLKKRWGASCESYPMQYQRDRTLNQQPLFVVLPIKEPIAENARKLEILTCAGAHIVESALANSQHVHYAWFCLVENRTHLAMMTTYDGDFDAYVEHFAVTVDLFDQQFEFLDVEQQVPIRKHPKQFVDNIRKYNRAPLGDYFFSAYPNVSVAEIRAAAGLP